MSGPGKVETLRQAGFMFGMPGEELQRLATAAGEKLPDGPPYDVAEIQRLVQRLAAKGFHPRTIHL
ncbi:MAG TPA: hypothetical protein VFF73_41080 [Planctomycetota bacterium]|nr:hypothetical protein [Planctomycetota bacterium]